MPNTTPVDSSSWTTLLWQLWQALVTEEVELDPEILGLTAPLIDDEQNDGQAAIDIEQTGNQAAVESWQCPLSLETLPGDSAATQVAAIIITPGTIIDRHIIEFSQLKNENYKVFALYELNYLLKEYLIAGAKNEKKIKTDPNSRQEFTGLAIVIPDGYQLSPELNKSLVRSLNQLQNALARSPVTPPPVIQTTEQNRCLSERNHRILRMIVLASSIGMIMTNIFSQTNITYDGGNDDNNAQLSPLGSVGILMLFGVFLDFHGFFALSCALLSRSLATQRVVATSEDSGVEEEKSEHVVTISSPNAIDQELEQAAKQLKVFLTSIKQLGYQVDDEDDQVVIDILPEQSIISINGREPTTGYQYR